MPTWDKTMSSPIRPTLFRKKRSTPPVETEAPSNTPQIQGSDIMAEERDWIRRTQAGDLHAFDLLMTRYRDRALRLATHILNRPDEAEDVVQEAFLRVYAQIGEFRGDARFYTWFYKVLVNCALNRMRTPFWKREKEPLLEGSLSLSGVQSEAAKSDAKLLAKHLLDTLSPPLRAAVVLRELEQRDYNEISEILGIPVGTVRSRLNAAREQLRNLYKSIEKETENV